MKEISQRPNSPKCPNCPIAFNLSSRNFLFHCIMQDICKVSTRPPHYERAKELNVRPELAKKLEEELKFARKMAGESMKLRGPNFTLDQLIEQEDHFQNGLQLMEAGQWQEAEQAFQTSIAMGDCLPQPWGNLGISLIMQERYDEAEAAFKRALVIDPKYTLAKKNLAALPEVRRTGPPAIVGIKDPFRDSKLKQSITFIRE